MRALKPPMVPPRVSLVWPSPELGPGGSLHLSFSEQPSRGPGCELLHGLIDDLEELTSRVIGRSFAHLFWQKQKPKSINI